MARIIIADDHPVVRKGLRQAFAATSDLRVIAEAKNGRELLQSLGRSRADLVVMDISMPGRDGLEVLEELKHNHPKLPVLIYTVHAEEELAMRALQAGAAGYVTKDVEVDEIIDAVRLVLSGKKYVTPSLAQTLASNLRKPKVAAPHEQLSNREYKVMRLMALGKPLTEIADELSVSVKTISTYRTRIMQKLGTHNNVELTRYAMKQDLIK